MDGYAVRYDSIRDIAVRGPATLSVIGQVAAGQLPHDVVVPETAVRIMTGAPIPEGADTVVPFEETDEFQRKNEGAATDQISTIRVVSEISLGSNIRPAGQDIRNGQLALSRGSVMRASEIGVAASLGRQEVQVTRRPVVAIIATGDELLEPGEKRIGGKIYDSNSYGVAAAVRKYGGIPLMLGIARDNLDAMNAKLDQGLGADLLITSAGVSKGDYDIVKDVLASRGEISFWSVRMRPAKPLAFGFFLGADGRKVPHVGLPGNPVSALVAFEEMVRPAILKMLGRKVLDKPVVRAILEGDIINYDGRRVYARVVVTRRDGRYWAQLTGDQGSGILTSMALANGLAICPEDLPSMSAGQEVDVQMLDWPEEVF
jgi:molybdopterin molybdotransferase